MQFHNSNAVWSIGLCSRLLWTLTHLISLHMISIKTLALFCSSRIQYCFLNVSYTGSGMKWKSRADTLEYLSPEGEQYQIQ